MTTEHTALQDQINSLKKDLKRQRIFNIALLVIGITAVSATQVVSQNPPTKEMTLRTLKITGPDGKVRILLSGDPAINKNGGSIAVLDDTESVHIGIMADRKGGNVSMLNAQGDPVALLGFDGDGGLLSLSDARGKGKINAAALKDAVGVNIAASDGKSELNLAAAPNATGLQVESGGTQRLVAGTDKLGGTLEVYDGTGKLKKKLP